MYQENREGENDPILRIKQEQQIIWGFIQNMSEQLNVFPWFDKFLDQACLGFQFRERVSLKL